MVAHADWYAPAPVQILSASTDAAKKAELVSQRAALINEGKANPIASTRKEYLDMKARHCRPRAITEHLARSRTQPQLSALSSQLSASASPTPPSPPLTCAGGLLRLRARQIEGSTRQVAAGRPALPALRPALSAPPSAPSPPCHGALARPLPT